MNKSILGYVSPKKNKYKVLIIGGGHNGLICGIIIITTYIFLYQYS